MKGVVEEGREKEIEKMRMKKEEREIDKLEKQVRYETAGDYKLEEDEEQRTQQINALVEDFGEVVYQ